MATVSAAYVKGELPPNTVESIVLNTDHVPDEYMYGNSTCAPSDSLPWMDDLIIDFSRLSSQEELQKLHSALTSWGCFQIVNHGMESSFLDEVRRVMRLFFALPLEEKNKYSRVEAGQGYDGYGNDSIIHQHQTLDWNDRLFLTVYPENRRKLKLWPSELREILAEYAKKHKEMVEVLLKKMARLLDLEEDQILNKHGEEGLLMSARFNFYPRCSTPERVLGTKTHSDRSTITCLLQDDKVDGLQVLRDGQWFKAPVISGAIFVNAGDLLEIMSNGIYRSAVHKAVANSERERTSLVIFCFPSNDAEVETFEELISHDRPRMYKKVKNYVDLFFHHYQRGQRALDTVRI